MSYLKHITVALILIGATVAMALDKISGQEYLYVLFFIAGYVFKNGYGAKERMKLETSTKDKGEDKKIITKG
jgi:hypothetical protein